MQSGYKMSFENIVRVFFTAEFYSLIPTTIDVIILDLGPEYSFVNKKER